MSGYEDELDLDAVLQGLSEEARTYGRLLKRKLAAIDLLKELRDGVSPAERREVEDLEDLFDQRARMPHHRRPARPDFGGEQR